MKHIDQQLQRARHRGLEIVESAELEIPLDKSLPYGKDIQVARIQDFDSYHTDCGIV